MDNCKHNLVHQLSETLDSLWRMDQYIKDAQEVDCEEGANFWREYKKTLEGQVEVLKTQLEKVVRDEGL